ncbi:MAG TPA: cytochrome c oxidase subunit 3 [Caulobacteraceae bacterium]|nr:cytochrome c oxidase subunit 3 [Caulobacteraceae bacterium]
MADASIKHDYHLVHPSAWPLIGSIFATAMAFGLVIWMKGLFGLPKHTPWVFLIGLAGVLYTMVGWWSDVVKEANGGDHTPVVSIGLRYGMILFIASEVMFFVAWFWIFFEMALFHHHRTLSPIDQVVQAWSTWPPKGVEPVPPFHLALVNTLTLLTSGTTVTWAHHALLENDRQGLKYGLILTVLLGASFTCVQAYEYAHAAFHFSGNVYGATFFMATGFHGFHVLIGTIFLIVCLIRAYRGHFTPTHHLGFEFAAWYWHFVDVVWLFLFSCVYVWGSWGAAIEGAAG